MIVVGLPALCAENRDARSWALAASRAGPLRGAVALTGRAAIVAAVGALVIIAFRNIAALVAVDALILAGIAADLLLAAPVRTLRLARAGDTRIRLGETGQVTLTLGQPGPAAAAGPGPGRLAAERRGAAGAGRGQRSRPAARSAWSRR